MALQLDGEWRGCAERKESVPRCSRASSWLVFNRALWYCSGSVAVLLLLLLLSLVFMYQINREGQIGILARKAES